MRVGPDTGVKSTQTYSKWKDVMKDGSSGSLVKCGNCRGMGYKRSRVKNETTECPKCKGWGFMKTV